MVLAGYGERALGDVLGEVADALQVAGDAQRRQDVRRSSAIGWRRAIIRMVCSWISRSMRVDRPVARDHRLGEVGVAALQRIEGLAEALLS